jgi:thiamine kinase-like enzyme
MINRNWNPDEARHVVNQLHDYGYHHHDLRLDNFVRGKDGTLRVIDLETVQLASSCVPAYCIDRYYVEQHLNAV